MRVVACQLDIVWEDKTANHENVRRLLAAAGNLEGALVVLPEMFATGFSMNVSEIHEGDARPSETFLAEMAAEHRACFVGGVVTQGADGKGRNEAVVFGPDGYLLARYAKLHPFTFGQEAEHYSPGDKLVVFTWQDFSVAPFICYDLRFPEVFRAAVRPDSDRAQLLLVIANWPDTRAEHWAALLRARAIENQAYVVGVNRCGADPELSYAGGSMIVGPRGDVLADAGIKNEETIVSAGLELPPLLAYRREFPALQDMHDEAWYRRLR